MAEKLTTQTLRKGGSKKKKVSYIHVPHAFVECVQQIFILKPHYLFSQYLKNSLQNISHKF